MFFVFAWASLLIVGLVNSRGIFRTASDLQAPIPKETFSVERGVSFRGGINYGTQQPARFQFPSPEYDNTVFSATNFFQHELIYLENNLILDWQPSTAQYRVYRLVRHPDNVCPAIPETPIMMGTWPDRIYHKFVHIGCNGNPPGSKLFDYDPTEGTYQIFRFNQSAGLLDNPMMESLSSGYHRDATTFQPIYLNEDEMLFYEKKTSSFSIFYINSQLPSAIDPLQPDQPINFGKLETLHEQLIYIGKNMIMDYDPLFGRYFIYKYDRTYVGNTNPFIGPVVSGLIEKGYVPTYVAEDQMALFNPETGLFRFFNFTRPTDEKIADFIKNGPDSTIEKTERINQVDTSYHLKSSDNFGFGTLVAASQCAAQSKCRDCVKVDGCGWCGTSSQCVRGSSVAPCGQNCTSWFPVFCEAEPCSIHAGCSECLADPFCGWCAETATCSEGIEARPLFGQCSGWSKISCPNHAASINAANPCLNGEGMLSL